MHVTYHNATLVSLTSNHPKVRLFCDCRTNYRFFFDETKDGDAIQVTGRVTTKIADQAYSFRDSLNGLKSRGLELAPVTYFDI